MRQEIKVSTKLEPTKPNLLQIQNQLHTWAKTNWWVAKLTQLFTLIASGVIYGADSNASAFLSFIALVTLLFSALRQMRSEALNASAQTFLRKYEFAHFLGWDVEPFELRNLMADLPKKIISKVPSADIDVDAYYYQVEDEKYKKTLNHIMESAFFSQHLAKISKDYFIYASFVAVAISFTSLFFVSESTVASEFIQYAPQISLSIIGFVFSAGILQQAWLYRIFEQKCRTLEADANALLKKKSKMEDVVKLLHEYQMARGSAPFIMTWIYKRNKKRLNILFQTSQDMES